MFVRIPGPLLRGVYTRKLASAPVLHLDDYLVISYRVYMVTARIHIAFLWRVILKLVKYTFEYNCGNLRMRYSPQSTEGPISYWICFQISERNSRSSTETGVNFCRYDSLQYDILWWYHVNEFIAIIWNRTKVAPLSCKHLLTFSSFLVCSLAKLKWNSFRFSVKQKLLSLSCNNLLAPPPEIYTTSFYFVLHDFSQTFLRVEVELAL